MRRDRRTWTRIPLVFIVSSRRRRQAPWLWATGSGLWALGLTSGGNQGVLMRAATRERTVSVRQAARVTGMEEATS